MEHVVKSFVAHVAATEDKAARDIKVFITDEILDYKDKAVLKHLYNSGVDIMALSDITAARQLAEELDSQGKLVTSQENVNIRYEKWHLAKNNGSNEPTTPCEDPSIGPDHIYNESVVQAIADRVLPWCRSRNFQSFISYEMLEKCVAHALYGDETHAFDEQQMATINFVKDRFAQRYCIISPFNNNGYNLGSEMMALMFPNKALVYRAEKYVNNGQKKTYFILRTDRIINPRTRKAATIPASTFGERSPLRLKIDTELYFSSYTN